MKNNVLFIVNKRAGRGVPGADLLKILDVFSQNGIEPKVHITQSQGDAYTTARMNAPYYDMIVCYGGDGTLDEVSSGILESEHDTLIGYIPAGSTNDFAASLRLSSDATEAAENVVNGKEFLCDVGSLNGRYFVYVAAFGVFTEVSYKTAQDMKNSLGHMAYVLEGAKNLFEIKHYNMRVEIEDEVIEGDFIYGMITNSESVGGIKNIVGNDIYLDDGEFEVVLVRDAKNIIDLEKIIGALLSKKSVDNLVYYRKAKKVYVIAKEPVPWTLDGEDGGKNISAEIVNHNKKLRIMVNENFE